MAHHYLKTDPAPFAATAAFLKPFEIRFNDRNYQPGDWLTLKETVHSAIEMQSGLPLEYTGREAFLEVTYVLEGPIYGLEAGWVILGCKYLDLFKNGVE